MWKTEADQWRLPYWDWARTNRVPELAKYPTITVPKYDGTGVTRIDNPLFQFRNPTEQPMISAGVGADNPWESPEDNVEDMKFGACIGTSRWPDEVDRKPDTEAWRQGVVNNYKVADKFRSTNWAKEGEPEKPYGTTAEMVFRLLTVPIEYITFASTKLGQLPRTRTKVLPKKKKGPISQWTKILIWSTSTITSTAVPEVKATWPMFPLQPLILSSGCTTGKC
ncbi:hypothetical protein CNMCM5623_005650 [Aspergillus felis]|uniref:Tyrosinase copper-binding domain-containing protein n=1 Tax=Aspergillus felis TaxID=1287682 RepID=A0A8H6V0E5_9EURO|nr:hypothetical protein CNMCM5623_005650 [Aspergillus felis]